MNKKDQGFTLVELLIVIVILGILATVTVFAVRGITDTGQENACSIEARTLDSAIEAYYAQTGSEPTAAADLVPGYLRDLPDSGNWTFVPADNTTTPPTPATFTAVAAASGGECA